MANIVKPGPRPLMFLLTEATGNRSRDNKTVAAGSVVVSGQVCGDVTATGATKPLNVGASTGEQVASSISCYRYDATTGAIMGAFITSDAELIEEELYWPVGITPTQKLAAVEQLRTRGIKIRPASF